MYPRHLCQFGAAGCQLVSPREKFVYTDKYHINFLTRFCHFALSRGMDYPQGLEKTTASLIKMPSKSLLDAELEKRTK